MGQEGGGIRDPTHVIASERTAKTALGQVAIFSAIVASMICFPLGLGLAVVLRVAGIAFETTATFGGVFSMFLGIAVWWLLFFAGSLVYVVCVFPWDETVLGWQKKN